MEVLHATASGIKCPHCGNKFDPEEAFGHDIRQRLEREYEHKTMEFVRTSEERIKRQEQERFRQQVRLLEEDRKMKADRLREVEREKLALERREQQVRDREESAELEMNRRLMERERLIRTQAEKLAWEKASLEMQERERKLLHEKELLDVNLKKRIIEEAERAREEERLKTAELQKKLDDQVRLVNEMKRKSEQGSMQLQGEVQELAIESFLKSAFPQDEIEEVSKGKRGGDCIHIVKDDFNKPCGRVLYESKRTKHFSHEWIGKVKDDLRLQQADLAVIVTEAVPVGMTRFGELEGVWICSFSEFKALAMLFRHQLVRIGEIRAAQENRGDKMQMIYSYVTSSEFRQKLEASFESFRDMQNDLMKEKAAISAQWAKREKRLRKAMENLVTLYGDVRGIAGGAVSEIQALETGCFNLLDDR